jgi:histone deacetylase 1/2
MIICMLVMVRASLYLISFIQKIYTPHRSFTLSNVLHVPAITKPLLSVQKFCLDNNVYFEFHPRVFYVKDLNTHEILLSGQSKDGIYALTKSSVKSIP